MNASVPSPLGEGALGAFWLCYCGPVDFRFAPSGKSTSKAASICPTSK